MDVNLSQHVLWHGTEEGPSTPRWLLAGPLAAGLEEGQLRGLYVQGREAVRRIYAAVRDRFWNTVPGVITNLEVVQSPDGFRVSFTSEHVSSEVDFVWQAEITGTADGTVRYVFDGQARRDMLKNRVGLCVLLPLSLAGRSAEVDYVSGDTATVDVPEPVDPRQPVRGLHDFHAIRWETAGGTGIALNFEGDVFEIEDQRNWTDASFKIYSTPQRIPMPGKIAAGRHVRQAVTLRLSGNAPLPPAAAPDDPETLSVIIADTAGALPAIGTGTACHAGELTARELARLRALGLAHYRIEIDPSVPGWQTLLEQRLREAEAMQTKAEIVIPVSAGAESELRAAADVAEAFPGLTARWLVLSRGAPATLPAALDTARNVLGDDFGSIGGGTDADFFQLNNNRPPQALMDFVSVPLRPCAHQFDRATLFENLTGQREVLRTMASLWPDLPLVVSPVSIRTRAQKGPVAAPGELPSQADVRQMSLLGAAWTVGCLKALAESGVSAVTLFQTTGLRGLMEHAAGSAAPSVFHSIPGGVFPVYLVLAALAGWQGADVLETAPSGPLEVLVLAKENRRRVLLANTSSTPHQAVLHTSGDTPLFTTARAVLLDAGNVAAAMAAPESWLSYPPSVEVQNGAVTLPPFAVAWLDILS